MKHKDYVLNQDPTACPFCDSMKTGVHDRWTEHDGWCVAEWCQCDECERSWILMFELYDVKHFDTDKYLESEE
jgi:transcriptional regulator NrdR family protein